MAALIFVPPAWKEEFLPTKLEIERARKRTSRMALRCRSRSGRSHPYRSFMKGKGMMAGMIGEEIVKGRFADFDYATGQAAYDYDLFHPKFGRTEVKTKQCGSPPQMKYFCSIAESSLHQECDYYAFVRLLRDYTRAWFVGMLPREEFFAMAVRYKKGDRDPTAPKSSWRFAETCYNVSIRDVLRHPCNKLLKAIDFQP